MTMAEALQLLAKASNRSAKIQKITMLHLTYITQAHIIQLSTYYSSSASDESESESLSSNM